MNEHKPRLVQTTIRLAGASRYMHLERIRQERTELTYISSLIGSILRFPTTFWRQTSGRPMNAVRWVWVTSPSLPYTDPARPFLLLEVRCNRLWRGLLSPCRSISLPDWLEESGEVRPACGRGPNLGGPKGGVCMYTPSFPWPWLWSCSSCSELSSWFWTSATVSRNELDGDRGEICC